MRKNVRFGLVAVVCGLVALLAVCSLVFTGRPSFDDEGYVLVSLRGWMSGHALYDDVFTQYGPGFFVLIGGPLRLLGITTISIEAARVITAVLTLITGASLGFVAARISGSRYAGLFAGIAVSLCSAVGYEAPLHPTHVVQAVMGCTVAAVVLLEERWDSRVAGIAVGVGTALCLLVKVNAGGILLVAVAVGMGLTSRSRAPSMRLLVPVGVLAVVAVIGARSDYPSMFLVLLIAAGLVVVFGASGTGPVGALRPTVATVAAGVTGIAIVVVALATGTSASMLFRGTVVDATRLADAFTLSFEGGRYTLIPLLVIAAAAWFVKRDTSRATTGGVLIALGACAAGVAYNQRFMGGTAHGMNTLVLGAAVSWIIVRDAERRLTSSRLVIAALALLLPLIAYPVAGGQRQAASILFPVIGAIAVVDGGRRLVDAGVIQFERLVPVLFSAAALLVGSVVIIRAQKSRADSVPIPFAGNLARTTERDAKDIVGVVAALEQCGTFYSLPGLNSFYLLANKQPPTWQNAGAWTNLFDADRQSVAVRDLERVSGLCVIRNRELESFWTSGGEQQPGPLRPFLESKTVPVATVGDYEIYR